MVQLKAQTALPEPRLDFQHSYALSVTPVQRNSVSSSSMYKVHIHTYGQNTHAQKTKVN